MVDVCSTLGFPGDSVVKNLPVNAGDLGSIPGLGRCLPAKRRKWQSTPVGCLKNSMDRGAWWAIVHGIAMSWTQLSDERTTTKASSSFSLVCKQSISYSRVGGISYSFLLLSTTKSLPDRWCPWDIGWINEHLMCSLLVIFLEFPAWSNTPSCRHALLVRVPMTVSHWPQVAVVGKFWHSQGCLEEAAFVQKLRLITSRNLTVEFSILLLNTLKQVLKRRPGL